MIERPGSVEAPVVAPGSAENVARALGRRLPPALASSFGASFLHSSWLYDEFVHRLTLGVVGATGLDGALREGGSTNEIAVRADLETARARVPLDWLLRRLAARQVLDAEGEADRSRFRLRGPLPKLDPGAVREAQRRHDPGWLPSYVVAETVASDYPAFLRGAVAGEDILFSPARFRLWVDYFSNDNGLYVVNNRVGALAVDEWTPSGRLAILELGGGLGSAAEALLGQLAGAGRMAEVGAYHFTDLFPVFVRRGQRALEARFPDASFLTFGCLDMNRSFAEQGIAPGSVSVVYAVNTLHIAHDLAFTLGEALRALEPGGWLIVSECVRPQPGQPLYVEFVFNLMETFRSARLHPQYRPNGGFLTPEQWRLALETAGFDNVRVMPDIPGIREEFPMFCVAAIGARRPR